MRSAETSSHSESVMRSSRFHFFSASVLSLSFSLAAQAALPFPHLKVLDQYTVFWPATLKLRLNTLPSIQNGTWLSGSFKGTPVSVWISEGPLREPLQASEVQKEWLEALRTQEAVEGLQVQGKSSCKTLKAGFFRCEAGAVGSRYEKPGVSSYVTQQMYFDSGRARILLQARSPRSLEHASELLAQFRLHRVPPLLKRPLKAPKAIRTLEAPKAPEPQKGESS